MEPVNGHLLSTSKEWLYRPFWHLIRCVCRSLWKIRRFHVFLGPLCIKDSQSHCTTTTKKIFALLKTWKQVTFVPTGVFRTFIYGQRDNLALITRLGLILSQHLLARSWLNVRNGIFSSWQQMRIYGMPACYVLFTCWERILNWHLRARTHWMSKRSIEPFFAGS